MSRVRVSFKIALCLAFLSASALVAAWALGLFPDPLAIMVRQRVSFCEALAIHCSSLAQEADTRALERSLGEIVARNPDICSAALRRSQGEVVAVIGDHSRHWEGNLQGRSSGSNIYVPILAGGELWGAVEVAFRPLGPRGFWGMLQAPWLRFAMFAFSLNVLMFIAYLQRTLTQLDPAKAVPQRVRSALDTFAEGLMVLDDQGRIVLANQALAEALGASSSSLEGKRAATLPLRGAEQAGAAPWQETLQLNERRMGVAMTLTLDDGRERIYKVNTSPILDGAGKSRGVFASFNDITPLERKKAELLQMLDALKKSRAEIEERNRQLQFLATRDPLTGCLNRRSFFEGFEAAWQDDGEGGRRLACLMIDVDFFKSINDDHGHSMGDEVLRRVGATLIEAARPGDLVCRFGGEEFCLLLPQADLDFAAEFAEQLRRQIAALTFPGPLKITASLGASSICLGASGPQQLLDQADKCLYVAKRNGRNQVVRFDQAPADLADDESPISRTKPQRAHEPPCQPQALVSCQAASTLLSHLVEEDAVGGVQVAQAADLAAATGRELISASDLYVQEVAALLHDMESMVGANAAVPTAR